MNCILYNRSVIVVWSKKTLPIHYFFSLHQKTIYSRNQTYSEEIGDIGFEFMVVYSGWYKSLMKHLMKHI